MRTGRVYSAFKPKPHSQASPSFFHEIKAGDKAGSRLKQTCLGPQTNPEKEISSDFLFERLRYQLSLRMFPL